MNDQDRRHFLRFDASCACFAALKSGETTVGRIRDISMGGLAFEYLDNEDLPTRIDEMEHVDLFMSGGKCAIRKIPCKTVRDKEVNTEESTFAGIGLRLRGLQFIDLSEQDSLLVETYIEECYQA